MSCDPFDDRWIVIAIGYVDSIEQMMQNRVIPCVALNSNKFDRRILINAENLSAAAVDTQKIA